MSKARGFRRESTLLTKTFLKNESGVAVLFFYMLIFFMILGVVSFDYSRAHAVRAKLRTATDAAALSGSMNAYKYIDLGECEYECIDYDGDGICDEVKVHVPIKAVHMKINPAAAENAAKTTYNLNAAKMRNAKTESKEDKIIPYAETEDGDCDQYEYKALVKVHSFLKGGLFAQWLTGDTNNTIPIRARGTAEPVFNVVGP